MDDGGVDFRMTETSCVAAAVIGLISSFVLVLRGLKGDCLHVVLSLKVNVEAYID